MPDNYRGFTPYIASKNGGSNLGNALKRESGPSLKKLSKAEARAKYERYLKENPTGNLAYFDAWENMSKSEQRKRRDPLYALPASVVANVHDGKGSG